VLTWKFCINGYGNNNGAGLKILVTFALENEFVPWRAMHDFRDAKWGNADVFSSAIGGADVAVLLTGAGPRAARAAISKLAWGDSGTLEYCVSTGLAGALRSEYSIAQVLAAQAVISEGVRDDNGANTVVESSAPLTAFARDCGATLVSKFYSAERAISRADEKQHLGKASDAVEMESFEILSSAAENGVPAVAIRAISDLSGENLPLDMNEVFGDEGQVSIPRVIGQLVRHPQSLPGLVKLGQQSKLAAESLAKFLDRYIAKIAASAEPIELKAAAR
jgi:adenosylhomocysteine nucleosidase